MKLLLPFCLASALVAADPTTTPNPVSPTKTKPAATAPVVAVSTADEAIAVLNRLPDPLALAQLQDYLASASNEDAGKVLMHIAISSVRTARPAVMPMLSHRDPLVVDRALRAVAAIGWGSTAARQQIERLLAEGQPPVAALAAGCLGSGDDMRAVPALVDSLTKGPAEVSSAALTALQRLTRVDFKTDAAAWQAWYQTYRNEAAQRLAAQTELLDDPDPKNQIAAIQALAGMLGERQEAIDLIEPMLKADDPTVVMATRQALATLAPNEYTMPSAVEVVATTKPGGATAPAKAERGMVGYLADQGLFDTWYGIVLTTLTGILVLSGVLFLLRSTPVKNLTRRIGKVAYAGTARILRPIVKPLRKGTDRIVKALLQKKASGEFKKPDGSG